MNKEEIQELQVADLLQFTSEGVHLFGLVSQIRNAPYSVLPYISYVYIEWFGASCLNSTGVYSTSDEDFWNKVNLA